MSTEHALAVVADPASAWADVASAASVLAAEVRRLRRALAEIRDMHQTVDDDPGGPPYCPQCDADGYPDPCRTFAIARGALDGEA